MKYLLFALTLLLCTPMMSFASEFQADDLSIEVINKEKFKKKAEVRKFKAEAKRKKSEIKRKAKCQAKQIKTKAKVRRKFSKYRSTPKTKRSRR